MTEIQQNRWDQLVRRLANVVGGGSQVADTLNELFPVIDVEPLRLELMALSRMNVAFAASGLAASVGNNNQHQLFNPAGSGALIVVTRILMTTEAAAEEHRIAITSTALTTNVGNVFRRDTREGTTELSIGQSRTVQQAAGIVGGVQLFLQPDVTFELEDENGLFVLFPDSGVVFSTRVTNTDTNVSWMWKERPFEPAEVNF